MLTKLKLSLSTALILSCCYLLITSCEPKDSHTPASNPVETAVLQPKAYPSDVIPFLDQWKILNGDGSRSDELVGYKHDDFFFTAKDDAADWIVYKTPNSGITSKTSSNTRTELHQLDYWTPSEGGKLTGTCKVMHVSTSGDARVAASHSVVVGQIHGADGHENEPIKIFYKKYPDHEKGSVFWNYEINTEGKNDKRWDYSIPVWGHDMSVVGAGVETSPDEPVDGIALGEEFSYEINVYEGVMYVSFFSEGHPTRTFTKSLVESDFLAKDDIPEQTQRLFFPLGRDGVEQATAYAGEQQYFKQGAYNQTNGKAPENNMIWSTGADIYDGDIEQQYAHGDYTEVWFRAATVGPGTAPSSN